MRSFKMGQFKEDLFAEENLNLTPKETNRKTEILKLSPSSLNLFLECPRCFWLKVKKELKRPGPPVATIATGLDKVIKEYCHPYRSKGLLPSFLEGKVPGKLMHNFPNKGWLEFVDRKIAAKFGGYLDECLELEGNYYAALDYKTRGSKPQETHPAHQFQMDAYTFLLEANNFPTQRLAYLVYYIPKLLTAGSSVEFEIAVYELKTDPLRAKEIFYQALAVLKGSLPGAAKDCQFCQWTATAQMR
jgi:CRISPR/Cas system-associated exonuclease Cas4 (RecB family)